MSTIVKYNLEFNSEITDLGIELHCYRENHTIEKGGLGRLGHLVNCIRFIAPDVTNSYNSWTDLILRNYCSNNLAHSLTLVGASACGKTYISSLICFIEWLCSPHNTIVLIGGDNKASLEKRIWSHINKWHNNLPVQPGEFKSSPETKLIMPEYPGYGIFLKAIEHKLNVGFHPDRLIVFIDETSNTDEEVATDYNNWTSRNKYFRGLFTGNPAGKGNLLYKMATPILGYSSIDFEKTKEYDTIEGKAIILDLMKSPVYKNPHLEDKIPYLRRKNDIDKIVYGQPQFGIKGLGMNHISVLRYIRARFITSDIDLSIITEEDIKVGKAYEKDINYANNETIKIASLDPAHTVNGDECILRFGEFGFDAFGNDTLYCYGNEGVVPINLNVPRGKRLTTNEYIIQQVMEQCSIFGVEPENFIMDVCGAGLPLAQDFEFIWGPINKLDSRGPVSERQTGLDFDQTNKDIYDRKVTEMWFEAKNYIASGQVKGLDQPTIDELKSRIYDNSKKKYRAETKPEYKRRIHGKDAIKGSPDRGDCFIYLVQLAISKGFKYQNVLNTVIENRINPRFIERYLNKNNSNNAWTRTYKDTTVSSIRNRSYR